MFKKSFIKKIAQKEGVSARFLEGQLKKARAVIPLNRKKNIKNHAAIGEGLRIKINTNLGTSTEKPRVKDEIKKLHTAVKFGADTIMDLSVGGNLEKIRNEIIRESPVPLGTVPIYQAAFEVKRRKKNFNKLRFDDIWDVLKEQAEAGVDFFTIHAGILKKSLAMIKRKKRVGGIVSRGGSILAQWMHANDKENPLYENFDKVLALAKDYNLTLSLGDALRPGAIADSTDRLQLFELNVLGELVKRCRRKGVQVMVEGPGHIPLDEIAFNVWLEKKLCHRAPFYVLGPLPTDIAPGYDHIAAGIGAAFAGLWGADFLCVVTPAEHLRHPSASDVKEGTIASKLVAHSINLLRFKDEREKDRRLSLYRAKRKWGKLFPLTLDKEKAEKYRNSSKISRELCTMCGEFCSLKISEKCRLL